MVHNIRKAAVMKGLGELCSTSVRVELIDVDGKVIYATHNHVDGTCVIGVNLLRLAEGGGQAEF